MKVLITEGAGFIGSALIRRVIAGIDRVFVNLDKLNCSRTLESLPNVDVSGRYRNC